MAQGRKPSLEEVAAEALVSRATAYRYFQSAEALLLEASVDVAVPEAAEMFRGGPPEDPVARLERVDAALHDMIRANEAPLRMMLAQVAGAGRHRRRRRGGAGAPEPPDAADRGRARARPRPIQASLPGRLGKALALIVGPEAMVVFKDVLQVDDAEARKVRRWMIRALVEAARKPGSRATERSLSIADRGEGAMRMQIEMRPLGRARSAGG